MGDAALFMTWKCDLDGIWLCSISAPTKLCYDDGNLGNETLCYRSELFYDLGDEATRQSPFQKGYVYVFNGELSKESSVHVTCLNDTTLSHDLHFEGYHQSPNWPEMNISVSTTIQGSRYVGYTNCDEESGLFYCKDIYLWKGQQGAMSDVALHTNWWCDWDGIWLCQHSELQGRPLSHEIAHLRGASRNFLV